MARFKAANMRQWTARQKENVDWIVKQSIQDVSEAAQVPKAKGGRMPVDTRFLRNSYTSGIAGGGFLTGPAVYTVTVAAMEMGDTFQAGWTAPYARRREKGFVGQDSLGRTYNETGDFFMENALMQWSAINAANAAKVKG